jgi:tetratricopeptide (TPR) repeat protein
VKLAEGRNDYTGPRGATPGCPAPDLLIALGGDALPEDLRRGAEAHVAGCSACRALMADLDALDVEVPASLDQRVLGRARPGGAGWRAARLPMAAALVAAVALGVYYKMRQSAPPATVAATAPAAPAPRHGSWEVAKPALLLPLATALVVRGEEEEAGRALGAALAPYRTDDYVEAERRLEEVARQYPASADAWFYLGATRLLDGDAAGAADALTEARTRGVGDRDDEAAWLLATAEARLGRIEPARARLTTLCDGGGAFRTPACGALETLGN